MCDNFDNGQKQHLQIEDKKKKAKHDNLMLMKKKQLRKYKKKGKKAMRDNLKMNKKNI